jgi:hypothetical protein
MTAIKSPRFRGGYLVPFRIPLLGGLIPRHAGEGPNDERGPLGPEDVASEAVAFLVSAMSLKEAAAAMPNKAAAQKIVAEVDSTITALIDEDICPRWPGPPPPWPLVSQIAAEVTLVANTLAPGSLRTALAQVGSRILEEFARRGQADA